MLSDSDRHLLEAYLDDGLSVWEVQRVDTRLGEEAEFCSALDQLRAERLARIAAFNSLEPGDSPADRFADAFIASVHKTQRKRKIARITRPLAVAAACLMIGFSVGRIAAWTHSDFGMDLADDSRGQTPLMNPVIAPASPRPHSETHLVIHAPGPQESGPYTISVLDENGRVNFVQTFSRIEEAQKFVKDFSQYQARRQQLQQSPMLISDKF